jgi:hypothetical protein
VLDRIEREDHIDVSTGYIADEQCDGRGPCIHRNIKPDHLAILPISQGACSWRDGCGVRSNMKVNHVTKTRFQSNKRRYSDRRPEESFQDALEEAFAPLVEMINQVNDAFAGNCACHPVANSRAAPAPVANLADRDFSFGAGIAGADFARRQAQIKANSDAYIARNPIQRAPVTNSNDPAVQAMSEHSGGAVEYLRRKGGK